MKEPAKQCPSCSRRYVREEVFLEHLRKAHGFSKIGASYVLGRAKQKAKEQPHDHE